MVTKPAFTLGRRACGVLLHLSSLPGPHGIGDLGPQAYRFADFLASSAQSWWQMLPVGPIGAGNSPYSSPSSFAGNHLFISLESLVKEGLLEPQDLEAAEKGPCAEGRVDYDAVRKFKEPLLRKAATQFAKRSNSGLWSEFKSFYMSHEFWLDDYALYCVLKGMHGEGPWTEWAPEIRARRFRNWGRETLRDLGEAAFYHHFTQFLFQRQWARLRAYCARRGIGLIGDVPIFVAHDSADVWANQGLFQLDGEGRPTVVSGVPPDYFSRTGQLWGNPHYRWDVLRRRDYDWWLSRLRLVGEKFDAVRLDHFIAFQRYWEVPVGAQTARQGRWVSGPGADFFEKAAQKKGEPELIAEDLGAVTPEVLELRDRFQLPGMRVLQFAFGVDQQAESFLPRNYPKRCVAYTGTHDNDTAVGWFNDPGTVPDARTPVQIRKERGNALRYLGTDGKEIHWDMIRAVAHSPADTAIIPFQDLLGLGTHARMNRPGTSSGNWQWRLSSRDLTPSLAQIFRSLTEASGRALEARA